MITLPFYSLHMNQQSANLPLPDSGALLHELLLNYLMFNYLSQNMGLYMRLAVSHCCLVNNVQEVDSFKKKKIDF